MPSLYVDPTQFMSPEEYERALVNVKATEEFETALAEEKAREKEAARHHNHGGGPRTPEGKARSSRNAVKHGFAGANPVIAPEDEDAFNDHLASYFARFQPVDQPETDTVRRAAVAMWRLDRLYALETIILDLESDYHVVPSACILPHDAGAFTRSALAFRESAGDVAHERCNRYIQAASREHDRAIRTFYFLESKRSGPANACTIPSLTEEQDATNPNPQQPQQPDKGEDEEQQKQPQPKQNKPQPNELLKTRPAHIVRNLITPYTPTRKSSQTAATRSDNRKKGPKVA